METTISGTFRKKRKSFAQVSNTALMDKTLSIKAKGLYAMIEAYISIPDFVLYKDFLMSQSNDGERSFNSGWMELKEKGYLVAYKIQTPKGFIYEYELLDEPTPTKCRSGESTSGKPKPGKKQSINNNKENNIKKNNILDNNNIIDNFFKNISLDDENKKFFSAIELRLKKLIKTFNEEEFSIITSLSKEKINDFCLAVINLYNDKRITNKEGYIRTILKDIDSFIENYKNKTFMQEQLEQYDSSKNSEITKEEEEAFYRLRYGSI